MQITFAAGLGLVCALICSILLMILVVPASRREQLPAFFRFLHDLFNFKFLILEGILKFFYILTTIACVFIGFFMLFSTYSTYGWYQSDSHYAGGYGILLIIFGPILVRIVYEGCMLGILLVKNTIEINNKLKNQNGDTDAGDVFAAPDVSEMREVIRQRRDAATQTPAAPQPHFCTKCGSPLDEAGNCPNCTKE